ncbi:hypothetical protein H5U35_10235 [Candidatus Aerophobetes bacterium]|nr:hypothetical protein [Candidatus Aerophobetes bacterium]
MVYEVAIFLECKRNDSFLKKKSEWYLPGVSLFLILFITGALPFPGEKESAEKIASPFKIYQRGMENKNMKDKQGGSKT